MYFCHGRKTENKLKCISAMEERQKTNQNVFLPWKKDKKQTKMYFCHGRKTENKPECISAMEERQKTN